MAGGNHYRVWSGPQLIGQDVQRIVMAAYNYQGIVNALQRAQQFGIDGFMNRKSLYMVGNPYDTICFCDGSDTPSTSLQGGGNN